MARRHDDFLYKRDQVIAAIRTLLGRLRCFADDRQDGPLDRFEDGTIGELLGRFERVGEVMRGERLFLIKSLRQSAQNLRKDYAGITPRAEQRTVRDFSRDDARRCILAGGDIAHGGLHGG